MTSTVIHLKDRQRARGLDLLEARAMMMRTRAERWSLEAMVK